MKIFEQKKVFKSSLHCLEDKGLKLLCILIGSYVELDEKLF